MFRNDYSEIGAPAVLDALRKHASEQNVGYGEDDYCNQAKIAICRTFSLDPAVADVHFVVGGTQANMVVISYFLRPYEAVIACDTGHIAVHETGAIEGSGHKVYVCPNVDGKLMPNILESALKKHTDEHMVKPRMVYISDTTETGTVYTAQELRELRSVCDRYGLLLYMDGARLGVALTSPDNDVDAKLIGEICDVFYVGGTKNGALLGEAIVIKDGAADFRYHIKNRGAMLAKGYMIGIQFETLFKDGLYFQLAQNSNDMAAYIREQLLALDVCIVGSGKTNQIFISMNKALAGVLMKRYGLELWEDGEDTQMIRLVTSFATKLEDCKEFVETLSRLLTESIED